MLKKIFFIRIIILFTSLVKKKIRVIYKELFTKLFRTLFQTISSNDRKIEKNTYILLEPFGRPIAQKIINLEIGNKCYDIEFVYSSFLEVFGNPLNLQQEPTFWEDSVTAEMAAETLRSLLQARKINAVVSCEQPWCIQQEFFIPYSLLGGMYTYSGVVSCHDNALQQKLSHHPLWNRLFYTRSWKSFYWKTSELSEEILIAKFYPTTSDRCSAQRPQILTP